MSAVGRRAVWILVVAALLPYLNALPNDFTLDDQGLILENEAVAAFDITSFFGQDYWAAYDAKATQLAEMFADNFEKYRENVSEAVRLAGPLRETA